MKSEGIHFTRDLSDGMGWGGGGGNVILFALFFQTGYVRYFSGWPSTGRRSACLCLLHTGIVGVYASTMTLGSLLLYRDSHP